MRAKQIVFGAAALAVLALPGGALEAQLPPHLRDYPLANLKKSGDLVAPFFDGWYDNGDGTVTYQFGFMNRNTEEIIDIPIGPDNNVEPAEFNGRQPTHFPVYDRGGFRGKRERGTFAVTVPKGQEVVWTLSHAGDTYSVPGRATSTAYELSYGAAAFGSLPPRIRFSVDGEESHSTEGIWAERVQAKVGVPVTLTALAQDRGVRERYETEKDIYPVTAAWLWHSGPGEIVFSNESELIDAEGWGTARTEATFTEPGEYVVRLRVDNFEAEDSGFDYVCCWSNAYVPVTVTP